MYNAQINPRIQKMDDTYMFNRPIINAITNETIPLFIRPSYTNLPLEKKL